MRDSNDIYIVYSTIYTSRRYLVLTQNIGRFADAAKKHIVEVVEVDWWHHGTHCKSCWCSRRSSRWSFHGADVQVVDVDGTMQSRSLWEAMRAKSGIKPSVLSSLPTGITRLLTNNDNWPIQCKWINEMKKTVKEFRCKTSDGQNAFFYPSRMLYILQNETWNLDVVSILNISLLFHDAYTQFRSFNFVMNSRMTI